MVYTNSFEMADYTMGRETSANIMNDTGYTYSIYYSLVSIRPVLEY